MTSFCWNDLPDPADLPFPSCCSGRPSLSGEGASATAPCTEQCSCMGFPSCWQKPSSKPSSLLLTKEKSSARREAGQDTACCSDRIEKHTAQNSQNYNKHAHACMSCCLWVSTGMSRPGRTTEQAESWITKKTQRHMAFSLLCGSASAAVSHGKQQGTQVSLVLCLSWPYRERGKWAFIGRLQLI